MLPLELVTVLTSEPPDPLKVTLPFKLILPLPVVMFPADQESGPLTVNAPRLLLAALKLLLKVNIPEVVNVTGDENVRSAAVLNGPETPMPPKVIAVKPVPK